VRLPVKTTPTWVIAAMVPCLCCYLVEGIFVEPHTFFRDALGETLDLGLTDQTIAACNAILSLVGIFF
jgi:hypothetical protein